MASLITMAVHDTEDNDRTWMTEVTLRSLVETVDFGKHMLMISDNGSCDATHALYDKYKDIISHVEYNGKNIGTANALNKLWRYKQPLHDCVVKIDNDVAIYRIRGEFKYRDGVSFKQLGWLSMMELVFERLPDVGICGLKRMDLEEWPVRKWKDPSVWYASSFRAVPHKSGEPWIIVEECDHVMGTCQAYRGDLVGEDGKFGYLWQPRLYGLDDSLAACRMKELKYKSVFMHTALPIDHVDPGRTEYITWKQQEAGKVITSGKYDKIRQEYRDGTRPLYYDGGFYKEDNG